MSADETGSKKWDQYLGQYGHGTWPEIIRRAHLAGQRAMREAAAAAVRAEEHRQTERPIWEPVSLPAMILDLPLLDPDQEGGE